MMHKQLQQQLKEVEQAKSLQPKSPQQQLEQAEQGKSLQPKPLLSERELQLQIAKQSAALVEVCFPCAICLYLCEGLDRLCAPRRG